MNPWRIDELMRDRRQYGPIGSPDPMVGEAAAHHLAAWKMDCAQALGWKSGEIALASLDSWATWSKRLDDAFKAHEAEVHKLEGGDR